MAETLGRNFVPNHVCIHKVCLVLCIVRACTSLGMFCNMWQVGMIILVAVWPH